MLRFISFSTEVYFFLINPVMPVGLRKIDRNYVMITFQMVLELIMIFQGEL